MPGINSAQAYIERCLTRMHMMGQEERIASHEAWSAWRMIRRGADISTKAKMDEFQDHVEGMLEAYTKISKAISFGRRLK